MYARRNLPSVSGLLALEAVARLGTATAAAAELNLTPGAISRALKEVEATLGQTLLLRDRQRLRLSAAGADYITHVRMALDTLGGAAQRLRSSAGGVLTLAILPAFGMHWLAPRLPLFRALHPEVSLSLSTRLRPFDLAAEGFDAAIHYGRPDWPACDHLRLMQEEVLPVCAPGFLQITLATPADILSHPLLMIESRTGDWGRWFTAQGIAAQRPAGMMFDQFATMQQAAIHGLGIALLPTFLIGEDLASGRLIPAWGNPTPSSGAYWLVWPKDSSLRPPLQAFRTWIAGMVGPEVAMSLLNS